MLVLFLIGFFIVCIILSLLFDKRKMKKTSGFLFCIGTSFPIVVFISAILVSVFFNLTANEKQAQYQQRYEALVYKVESKSYRDDFGLLNKEVIDEVQKWNEDISYNKKLSHNFWIGIFIKNIYDDFEIIDFEKFN